MQSKEILLKGWVERQVGPVTRLERQGRWRPAWFVDAIREGVPASLYVRGERTDALMQAQPLTYEYRVLKLLEQGGVRVPHVYGYIEEMPAIVMDRVPGAPGVDRIKSPEVRDRILSQFVDQMILIHNVNPSLMKAAGAPRPTGATAISLAYLHRIEPFYIRQKKRPEPAIEFLRGWLNRNVPESADIAYPICVDAGQFLFEGDQLTAMIDFEVSALGDYHADLAVLRLRDRMEPIGDLVRLYQLYAERSGRIVDRKRICFHTVVQGLLPALYLAGVLGAPEDAVDYVQYLSWNAAWMKVAFESIFEINGWTVEPFTLPQPKPVARYDCAISPLDADVRSDNRDDPVSLYQRRRRLRLTKLIQKSQSFQDELESRYLRDVSTQIGEHPLSWTHADEELERVIWTDDGSKDKALASLLLRQLHGQSFLLADVEEPGDFGPLTIPLRQL